MNDTIHRLSLIAAAAALAVGLAACNKNDDRTPGEKLDSGIAQTEAAADEAKAKAAEAGQDIKDAAKEASADASAAATEAKNDMKDAAADAKNAAEKAGADIRAGASDLAASASAAAGAVAAVMDDAGITASVKTDLAKDPDLSALAINVDTKDGVVTLNGPAPNAAAKDRAETIAKGVKGVKSVSNNLAVKG
ncbi:BON domain-containing protein [Ottowia sp. GY511]|uniref:BON domain-containing protein n=1 Tax=Ottowia flava TaxID=2675430 RepID=A0ABW4KPG1_9BURK|nr:BON domain-containing protein [Ottowia sp. GY511]TXK27805.1 BON domain-containing protein [Ottowia sp. GY511]